MAMETQELRARLIATDAEFRQLAEKHQELDTRLNEISRQLYLTEPDQLEQTVLKKRKLQLKDRMEDILRRHRTPGERPSAASQEVTPQH
jgi:uncharacterized protein YdcH (DUF465 family)